MMVRRISVVGLSAALAWFVFAIGCSGDPDTNTGDGDGDGDGDGYGGDGGSSGGDGDGDGDGAVGCPGASSGSPPASAELTWEALPSLYATSENSAGEAVLRVGPNNEIYVAASVAQGAWEPPGEVMVQRYSDDAWEVVGGGPVARDESSLAFNLGLAVSSEGRVFAAARANGATALYEAVDDEWLVVDIPVTPSAGGLVTDGTGHVVVLGRTAADESEVYRLVGDEWEQMGDAFQESAGALPQDKLFSASPDVLALVASSSVFQLVDDAWVELGPIAEGAAFTTLAVSGAGDIYASYRIDGDEGTELHASKFASDSEAFEPLEGLLEFEGPGASYSVLRVDPWGRLVAAWRESAVYVGTYVEGEGWEPYLDDGDVSQATDGGTLPSLALSQEGLPVVSYEGFTAEQGGVIGVTRAVCR